MSERKSSQKGFVAVTLITVLAIAMVIVVYASLLATIPGGEVVVGEDVAGQVHYSEDNASWTTTLNVSTPSDSWWARINFTSQYTGLVSITWRLQKMNATWVNMTMQTTTVELDGSGNQIVYASPNGATAGNHDWGADISVAGQYRVKAWVETTS